MSKQTYTINKALEKGLKVLEIIGSSPTPVTASNIADQADMTYATTMNNIITLEHGGYIEKQGSGYIGSFKLAKIWTNRVSYLRRKREIVNEEIRELAGE